MRLRCNPTKIALHELPDSGKTFDFNRETGELNSTFADLISPSTPFTVSVHIKPIGNAFELSGKISTRLNLPCSLCGNDLPLGVEENLHEVLVVGEQMPRDAQSAKVNHASELLEGASAEILESDIFDLAEYLHEILALVAPIRFTKNEDCEKGLCPEIAPLLQKGALKLDSGPEKEATHNPFTVLQTFKLKS
jgi:uncharacterized metal-binding protein YceD (DUF177 family)